MSLTSPTPSNETSSKRPTKGEMYVAPALEARIACATENINVTLTLIPSTLNLAHARSPSLVQGTLIVAHLPNFLCNLLPSEIILTSLPMTSILISLIPSSFNS